jgi:hypothetical protein
MIRAVRRRFAAAAATVAAVTAGVVGAVAGLVCVGAAQGRFNVTPTTLVLRQLETSTSLLLKNESAEAIRFR